MLLMNMQKDGGAEAENHKSLYFGFYGGYAKHYGREASQKEYEKYGNAFTSKMYFKYGYFFNEMQGQGCAIHVTKEEELPDEEMITVSKNELINQIKKTFMKIVKNIIAYKEKKFDSWLEFILTLGIIKFNEGGFLIFLYSWGAAFWLLCMWIMLSLKSF